MMEESTTEVSESSMMEAIQDLNCDLLLDLLPDSSQQPRMSVELMRCSFFHAMETLSKAQTPEMIRKGERMIYLLRNLGGQINRQDENGNTPLMSYIKKDMPSCHIVEAMLRCNADAYLPNKAGDVPFDVVTSSKNMSHDIKDVFQKYVPGVWAAVQTDDASAIRKLINQWCRVDVQKNGKTLLQLALEIGNEHIIRVVSGIRPSMEFAHSVLAGDAQMLKRMLRLKLKMNINFRNLGDRGKTPLFYALQQNSSEMVQTLLDRGARLDVTLKGKEDSDVPLFFAALHAEPPISTALLKTVIPISPIRVDTLYYKGCNILFYCIENHAGKDLVDFILAKGSAYLVTQRVENNRCAREIAEESKCEWAIKAIDNAVVKWMYQDDGTNRQILVLHGYQFIPLAIQNHPNVANNIQVETFYRYLAIYQDQICLLHKAVEDCDEETVRRIVYFRHPDEHSLDPCLADCRMMGDGQPLLHKAVLRRNVVITQILAETLVYQRKQRLDTVRDQFFRTVLHYAYAMEEAKELLNLLLDYGASEFTMDRDGRSPLAFKDRRGQELMNDLLLYHLLQDFTEPEPDPWTIPMPIPVIDFLLTSCIHSNSNTRPYLSSTNQHSLDSHLSASSNSDSAHHNHHCLTKLPCTEITSSAMNGCSNASIDNNNTILAKSHKFKSVSDTKLHKMTTAPVKPSFSAHLSHFPDVLNFKSRLTTARKSHHYRHHNKSSFDGVHKDYLPLPLENDSEEEEDGFDLGGNDGTDLLDDEKDMRKSTSCTVQ